MTFATLVPAHLLVLALGVCPSVCQTSVDAAGLLDSSLAVLAEPPSSVSPDLQS